MHSPIQHRHAPQTRDLTARTIQLRADTVDEEARSVEATIATEQPVRVIDLRSWRMIDEVLRTDGMQVPASGQVPVLDNHWRYSNDDVFGSARDIRTEGGQAIARLHFADVSDERIERTWSKIRQGHLTDVSVGYRVLESVDIAPNKSAQVGGRTYTAGDRPLRVATRWSLIEVSPTPIGADSAAKFRGDPPMERTMPPQLRAYLESLGLRTEATDAEAWQFMANLEGERHTRALELGQPPEENGSPPNPPADGQRNAPPAGDPAPEGQRNDPPAEPARSDAEPPNPEQIAQQAVTAERTRVRRIRELAGSDVEASLVQRAIDEGWTQERATEAFYQAVRSRPQPLEGGPAIHSRSREQRVSARSLAAGLLIGNGRDPLDRPMHDGLRLAGRGERLSEQDADYGDELRRLSALDLCRECAMLDTGRYHRDPEEAIRAATSGATFSYVFSTNVYAMLVEGFETYPDTTAGWCDEEDVPNFMQQEEITLETQSRMKKLPRGGTAKHATASDSHETYRIARYAEQIVMDEQDIIDDRLGALMNIARDMGEEARKLRPNLVYSLINQNPTLVSDSLAVFYDSRTINFEGTTVTLDNLGTGALTSDNLKLGISAISKMRDSSGNQLNLRPKYLLVPAALEWKARELTASAALAKLFADDDGDPLYTTANLIAQEGLRVVPDDRMGATGVWDPSAETVRTGSDTAWYLATGGRKSIRVAYRRGTGRAPQLRRFVLDRGQWGVGYDINMDIGAAFMAFQTWFKSTGAG